MTFMCNTTGYDFICLVCMLQAGLFNIPYVKEFLQNLAVLQDCSSRAKVGLSYLYTCQVICML